jgi:DNA-binding MarR family transcriptional regulator
LRSAALPSKIKIKIRIRIRITSRNLRPRTFDTPRGHFSLCGLNTPTQLRLNGTDQFRADAERLSHIILEMQRCFVLRLSKELAPGNVSFPQFFLLAALDQKEVLTMSAIAQKMGHTTAAASGLVDRLENLGYVVRSSAREDRRKVMVCITEKGSALVRRIREEMVGNLMKVMTHLTPAEQKAWLQIYTKIYNYCQAKEEPQPAPLRRKSSKALLTSRRFENGTR